jgi:hypothetical protein
MAERRTVRERPALFRRTDQVIPELEESEQPDSQTARRSGIETAKQQRVKATFYLNPDDIIAIDTMQTEEFRRTGKKPERSELVSRAIQLLSQQNS